MTERMTATAHWPIASLRELDLTWHDRRARSLLCRVGYALGGRGRRPRSLVLAK